VSFLRYLLIFLVVLLVVRLVRQVLSARRASLGARAAPPGLDDDRKNDRRRRRGGGDSPYEVLEVDPEASPAQIRAAYQRLVRQYHPDRTAQLAPELQELAEKRTKEINAAYQTLRSWGKVDRAGGGR
jgi:DnaJ-domain-containing protein 1